MSAAQTGYTVLPDWGSYAYNKVGLYYLLDKASYYGISFPISIKVNGTRHVGAIMNGATADQKYYCDRYSPTGKYFRFVYPMSKFGISGTTSFVYVEFAQFTDTSWVIKITGVNNTNAGFDVDASLLISAHAAMVSYSGGVLRQNHIADLGNNYIGASWSTQTTKVVVAKTDDTWVPQDIQDSNFIFDLDQAADPYVGDGHGRWCRGAIVWTIPANSTDTRYMTIAVAADEATAAVDAGTALTNKAATITNAAAKYMIDRSPLCNLPTWGEFAERLLAENLHFIRYINVDAGGVWKLINTPGCSYSLITPVWYNWDCAFQALAFAEAGYLALAKDAVNFPYGTDGTYKQWISPPVWLYVITRIYEITHDPTILTAHYAAMKARYDEFKAQFAVTGGYMMWSQNNDSGMDNGVLFSADSGANTNITPCALAYAIAYANELKEAAAVATPADVAGLNTDISGWKTKLETMWTEADGYYWGMDTLNSNALVKRKTISSLFPVMVDGLSTARVAQLRNLYRNDLLLQGGEVGTCKTDEARFTNNFWAGPSWNSTNMLIANGFRLNGDETSAREIEFASINNWDDPVSDNLREHHQTTGAFIGTTHFSSHNSCIIKMLKNSQIKRRLI